VRSDSGSRGCHESRGGWSESEADALRELGGGGASGDGGDGGGREANDGERVEECGHGGREAEIWVERRGVKCRAVLYG